MTWRLGDDNLMNQRHNASIGKSTTTTRATQWYEDKHNTEGSDGRRRTQPPRSAAETGGGTQEVGGPHSSSSILPSPLLTSLVCSNGLRRQNDTYPESEYPTKRWSPTTTTWLPPRQPNHQWPQRQPYHNDNPTTTTTLPPQQRPNHHRDNTTTTTMHPHNTTTMTTQYQTTRPPDNRPLANKWTPRPLIEPHNDQTRRLIATKRTGRKARRAREKDRDGEEGKDEGRGWGGQGHRARMSTAKDPLKSTLEQSRVGSAPNTILSMYLVHLYKLFSYMTCP